MLLIRFVVGDVNRSVPLRGEAMRIGRGPDNEIMLPDYSVSRRHARLKLESGFGWRIEDLRSTNGVRVNDKVTAEALLQAGDRIKIGIFELMVEPDPDAPAQAAMGTPRLADRLDAFGPPTERLEPSSAPQDQPVSILPLPNAPSDEVEASDAAITNATIVRSLSAFTAEYGLDGDRVPSDVRKREALDQAYASHVFGFLTQLARLLIQAETVDAVLEGVMEIAFDAFPVDRGFILLRNDKGALECALMRSKDQTQLRPGMEVPVSRTMLEAVMRERIALLTYDALSDHRLATQASVKMHQIRAAMCAPLWSGEKIMGVLQVDSTESIGSFTEQDVDLLTALANYAAVAIERLENAREVEIERQARSRLERYHSPAVIEAVLQGSAAAGEEARRLQPAEVSVMFADFVGFTAFSEEAAPSEVAEVMSTFFTHAVDAIFEAGGTLDKFIGDCVMAFFGAPMAQADHAQRAVRAAIQIQAALARWNAERLEQGLAKVSTRIGINSGPVVVGDLGSSRRVDYTVLGNTVNVAARLEEAVARPGEVVIGAETQRQMDSDVPLISLGEIQLKGLTRRIAAFRVAPMAFDSLPGAES